MKKNIVIATIGAAVLFAIAYVLLNIGSAPSTLGNIYTGTTTTTSSSTLTGTAAVILAQKTGAQYRSITNRSAGDAWLTCNSTSTGFVARTGVLLRPSTTIELIEEQGTMWCTDIIYGITDGGTVIVSTLER